MNRDGWSAYSIWDHSQTTQELYARRCRQEEIEMTCAAQAAELLAMRVTRGDTLLDAGCGSGYFYHSLVNRTIPATYFGIDASPAMVTIGHEYLPAFGLPKERLQLLRIEDFNDRFDHVLCMNVLSNIDNYHRPLERLLQSARKTVILRESLHTEGSYRYELDRYLDPGAALKVYLNTYSLAEVAAFIESYGYRITIVEDRYTGGKPQVVVDYPHYWKFIVAEKH